MTTRSVGTAAISENRATSRTCRRPLLPIDERSARRTAMRRPMRNRIDVAASRLATSNAAITTGLSGTLLLV